MGVHGEAGASHRSAVRRRTGPDVTRGRGIRGRDRASAQRVRQLRARPEVAVTSRQCMLWLLYIIGTEHHHYCIFSVLYIVTTVYIVATVFFMYLLYL